jgi:hypothetical protein
MKKVYYDICQEKILSGKNIPCFEKKDAACKEKDADCLNCKYFIDAASKAQQKINKNILK